MDPTGAPGAHYRRPDVNEAADSPEGVRIDAFEVVRVVMPLAAPFATITSTQTERALLLLRALGPDAEGWGECVAMSAPLYSHEYVDGAEEVITRYLIPRLWGSTRLRAAEVAPALAAIKGHPMAKAALEMAVLDAELRRDGIGLAAALGGIRSLVEAGVAVGILGSLTELVDAVGAHVDEGYRRVKIKIGPGRDLEPVRVLREAFPELGLQVDANGSYRLADAAHLARLDPFGLLLIEQPLADDDLVGHAELARRLQTPVCLDESIVSYAATAAAIEIGACDVVNIKAGRVGGLLEARHIHDLCVERGIPVWCGGMLETGIGRAANVCLASLPGFTLPGDLSASARYFAQDLTEPFVLEHGCLRVPDGPGIGVEVLTHVVDRYTVSRRTVRRL